MEAIGSRSIYLRLVETQDAEFVYSLRVDPRYNRHLSAVSGGAEAQRAWLQAYKQREAAGQEYYFIICRRRDDMAIGTIRVYDFIGGRDSFAIGSWILTDNKTASSALESMSLAYRYGFEVLGFRSCHLDVRKENTKVISFHEKFGAVLSHDDADNVYFTMAPEAFSKFAEMNKRFLTAK
ncbi:GNAT family N-acetyltransferase [Zhongshania guokunii]|uniref:GNAT family N-acetyltransferase n=1 Tax=Zhongshania guokunii TaxID=641783 RepID=A0ABV3UBM4_9GAMM